MIKLLSIIIFLSIPLNCNNLSSNIDYIQQTDVTILHTPYGFVKEYYDLSVYVADLYCINEKVLLAQAAIESGWGKYAKDFNFFGVKGNSQNGNKLYTTEFIDGVYKKQYHYFKSYESTQESFEDYAMLIKNGRAFKKVNHQHKNDLVVLSQICKSGYATAPDYYSKVVSAYRMILVEMDMIEKERIN